MNQPNILCFVTDQLRADHLGCAGNPDVKTPHIDALAADGVRFENSYVSNPVCSPNRACLFTGQYPKSNGLRENGNALPEDALTLPRCLQGVGYQTFSSGKLHLAPYGIPPELPTPDSWKAESKELWNAKAAPFVVPYHGLDQVYFVGGHGHYNFGAHRNSLSPQVSDGYLRVHAAQDPGSNVAYDLNVLKDGPQRLETDPKDCVTPVVRRLRLAIPESRDTITLEADRAAGPQKMYRMLDEYLNRERLPLSDLDVVSATIGLVLHPTNGRRGGRLTFDVSRPDTCTLRSHRPDQVALAQKYLRRWGIAVA